MAGSFIISLDFELHWGGVEIWSLNEKSKSFLNTRSVILEILRLFEQYNIRATWATVGFLFGSSREEVISCFPPEQPSYLNQSLNYYNLFYNEKVGLNESEDPYHFAFSIIEKILKVPGQELASHTFSHFYCNEPGQTQQQFELDLRSAQNIANACLKSNLSSLVFPRNQYNKEYLKSIRSCGFTVVRTNPDAWFWKLNSKLAPIIRAADTLFPVSKRLTFKNSDITEEDDVTLLPASRFFRPYAEKEKFIQKLKMNRIKHEMSRAARKGENYHLWWHPHNFGDYPHENLKQLKNILEHYAVLQRHYNFQSRSMSDFS